MQKADPLLAARLGPHDRARIVRAVGVWQASGKPLSFWQTQPLKRPSPHTFHTLCLMPSEGEGGRQWLKCRIARRFGQMMAEGALEEVRQLKSHLSLLEDLPPPPITRALGFQELSLLLEGQSTQDEAVNHAIIRSCQYAKRQCTWFRHQMPPHTSFIHPDQLILSP